jgi:UDP-N-acetyl-D-galactosamine dehydrogenase
VGGHCTGVDPYYLTHKAEALGYHPQVILAGRRINDGMGAYVAGQMVKAMLKRRIQVDGARVLMLGLTFKENCPDLRNTRVVDVVSELEEFNIAVDVYDPWVKAAEAQHEYGIDLIASPTEQSYDGVILAVAHTQFREAGIMQARSYGREGHVLYDLKNLFAASESDLRL